MFSTVVLFYLWRAMRARRFTQRVDFSLCVDGVETVLIKRERERAVRWEDGTSKAGATFIREGGSLHRRNCVKEKGHIYIYMYYLSGHARPCATCAARRRGMLYWRRVGVGG